MKRNGFTLMELLGVIVIIALLVILVFPSIINGIRSSSESVEDNVKLLINNAANLYVNDNLDTYTKSDKNTYCISIIELIESGNLDEDFINSSKNITLDYQVEVKYSNETRAFSYNVSNTCQESYACNLSNDVDDDRIIDMGDQVTCGTESFYVMDNDGSNVTMLSKFNLNIGDNLYPDESTQGIQNENVKGYVGESEEEYGSITVFSSTDYWSSSVSDYPAFVYNSNSNLYQYVSAYESYLRETLGVNSASATLMSYEQAVDLDCSDDDCSNAPSWINSTSYWTGSANNEGNLYYIFYGSNCVETDGYYSDGSFGVRPVVTISVNDISF